MITNLFADGIGSDCGPHQRWSTGGLFDDVTIAGGNDLQAFNRGNSGTGHGWAGANYVFWNCSARNLEIDNPPTAQNWAIGCIGNQGADYGIFDSLGTNVQPFSLYQKQLWDRMHSNPTVATPASATPNPRSGSTTDLSVVGGYALGESNLTYTWSVASKPNGAADPTFSANGTNAAKNSTATFSAAGTYALVVTISDAGGLLATSSVIVTDRPTTNVNGDADFANENDSLRIVRNGTFVDVQRNGVVVLHQDYATSNLIALSGLGGNDTITIDYSAGNPIPANGLIVDGGGGTADIVSVVGSSGNDAVTLSAGSVTVNGGQVQYADFDELDLAFGAPTDTLTISGNVPIATAALVLNVTGAGTLAMASGSTLPDVAVLNVPASATFDMAGTSQTVSSLNGAGRVTSNSPTLTTLTLGAHNANSSFAGTIANGSGGGGTGTTAVVKIGTGKLILSGTNSYTGTTKLSAGVIESGNAASFAGLSGQVLFNGGTFHVTANTTAADIKNKFTTSYTGATTASTATFDIDTGVTLTVGGTQACLQTNGGGSHGGTFTKIGAGTLRILSNNGQLDDPFKLNNGTVIVESASGLGGADNSSNHVDMKSGTTLVLRQDVDTNFLTPIVAVDDNATINVVIDRKTAGAAVTHSVNALSSGRNFTITLAPGSNITSGVAGLNIGTVTLSGNGTFSPAANSTLNVTTSLAAGAFTLAKTGNGTMSLQTNLATATAVSISAGVLQLAQLGTRVLKTPSLSVTGTGQLDLQDNKLIINAAGQTGTKSGSSYTGITGLVRSGRNGGGWNGTGIVTRTATALAGNLTTLAVAKVGDVRGIADTSSTMFAGQVVLGSDTIVMYTYGGDANLDGKINIDDYTRIDAGIAAGSSGWSNGDFNYDSKINIDDYTIIDTNIGIQGPPFSAASSASGGSSATGGITSLTKNLVVITTPQVKRTTRAIR